MSEDEDTVLFEIDDRVAYITLNRPDKHNAFDDRVVDRLGDIFTITEAREDLVAVVLRGEGESFSAGADLNWMAEAAEADEEANVKDARAMADMLHTLYTIPQMTIACVQGVALGGGMGLVACCDVVLAHRDTTFGLSEVRLGLIPATIAPYVLNAIGPRQARRYMQTGEQFEGDRALELNLVHERVESEEEMEEQLEELLEQLKTNGPEAVKKAKRLCLDFDVREVTEEVLEETAIRIARTRSSEEAREGVEAFLEDREPDWTKEGEEENEDEEDGS